MAVEHPHGGVLRNEVLQLISFLRVPLLICVHVPPARAYTKMLVHDADYVEVRPPGGCSNSPVWSTSASTKSVDSRGMGNRESFKDPATRSKTTLTELLSSTQAQADPPPPQSIPPLIRLRSEYRRPFPSLVSFYLIFVIRTPDV